jgi:uncharacterized protein YjbI with pentapeptide repeats
MTNHRKALTDRWKTDAGRALADEAMARLAAGRPLEDLPIGEHDGRLDLRFLPAPVLRRWQRFEAEGWFVEVLGDLVTLRDARVERIDFSGAQMSAFRIHDCRIADCRFDGAICRDWRLWGTEVVDCSFVKANLRGSAVGTWHEGRRNVWRRVDFARSDFRAGVSLGAVFEDCDFAGAQLAKVEFQQCTLAGCRFAGDLVEVSFDGRDLDSRPPPSPMRDVNLAEAVLTLVEFRGDDLEGIVLPKDPDVWLLPRVRPVARQALVLIDGDERPEARSLRALLNNRLRGPGTDTEADLPNRRDYLDLGGPPLLALAEDVLARAQTALTD